MKLHFSFLVQYIPMLLDGARMTLLISLYSLAIGFILGLVLALMRQSKNRGLQAFGAIWVEFLRNTPFLVQLFFFYYGLPELGIDTNPVVTAVIALGINSSSVNCETIRSGLIGIKHGYYEASYALGFSKVQVYRFIVIPITLRLIFKPLTSNFVNLILTSSVAFSITVNELMGTSKTIAASSARPFEIYIVILLGFAFFTTILSGLSKIIDKKIEITL